MPSLTSSSGIISETTSTCAVSEPESALADMFKEILASSRAQMPFSPCNVFSRDQILL